MTNYASTFSRIFEDSARIVLVVIPAVGGIEFQIFDRDSDVSDPLYIFPITDLDFDSFVLARSEGSPGWLWSAGATIADIEHNRLTGEKFPGIKLNGLV